MGKEKENENNESKRKSSRITVPIIGHVIGLISYIVSSVREMRKMREDGKIDKAEMNKIVEIIITIIVKLLDGLVEAKVLDHQEVRSVRITAAHVLAASPDMAVATIVKRVTDAVNVKPVDSTDIDVV